MNSPAPPPPEVHLRRAEVQDSRRIRELVWSARLNPSSLDWRRFLVAVDHRRKVVGCGQVKPVGGDLRELASIVVAAEWRGKGIARSLIEALMAEAGPPLWLTCASHLIPLYQRFGFVEVGKPETPRYYGRLQRLASAFLVLAGNRQYLAVMRWVRAEK